MHTEVGELSYTYISWAGFLVWLLCDGKRKQHKIAMCNASLIKGPKTETKHQWIQLGPRAKGTLLLREGLDYIQRRHSKSIQRHLLWMHNQWLTQPNLINLNIKLALLSSRSTGITCITPNTITELNIAIMVIVFFFWENRATYAHFALHACISFNIYIFPAK